MTQKNVWFNLFVGEGYLVDQESLQRFIKSTCFSILYGKQAPLFTSGDGWGSGARRDFLLFPTLVGSLAALASFASF